MLKDRREREREKERERKREKERERERLATKWKPNEKSCLLFTECERKQHCDSFHFDPLPAVHVFIHILNKDFAC